MKNLFKKIRTSVKKRILSGESPQAVYDNLSASYPGSDADSQFIKRYIAKRIQLTVTPENRLEYRFSYLLYMISLAIAVLVTIINKQHRIEALGIFSINSFSSLGAFFSINLYAWIYLLLIIRSYNFNMIAVYWSLLFAGIDVLRLLILFPAQWIETPFFAILRIIPPLLILLFGSFFVINCTNKFIRNKKSGHVVFQERKVKIPLRLKKNRAGNN